LLSFTATIITYELVLIQFKTSNFISDYNPCSR
jgi:Trehalose receptor